MLCGYTRKFLNDEQGGGTIMGLLWFILLVGITGLAVDITDGLRTQTMLQATADASALAAVIDLPDEVAAVATAVAYSTTNMATDDYGTVLLDADVDIGSWNASTHGHLEKCPDEPEPGQWTSSGLGILAFGRS